MSKSLNMKTHDIDEPDECIGKVSSGSTCVKDITGMIFGGLNSRFWMLRKHFNSMNQKELEVIQFYSWECISLQLKGPHKVREIDLVIRDVKKMDSFLKFLIYNLRTVDGTKGTANKILKCMN